jgi:hypothetical protein
LISFVLYMWHVAAAVSLMSTLGFAQEPARLCYPVRTEIELFVSRQEEDPDAEVVGQIKKILDAADGPSLSDTVAIRDLAQRAKNSDAVLGKIRSSLVPRRAYAGLRKRPVGSAPAWGYRLVSLACELSDYDSLDGQDRIICKCAALKSALLDELPKRSPSQADEILRGAFRDSSAALAKLDPAKALPYVDDLILVASELAVAYPEWNLRLGDWLGGVLEQARAAAKRALAAAPSETAEHKRTRAELEQIGSALEVRQQLIVDLDHGSIAGTGRFLLALRLICEAEHSGYVLNRIKNFDAQRRAEIRRHLLHGAQLLKDPARAWLPFKQYSDTLLALYRDSECEPLAGCQRQELAAASARVLFEGLQRSVVAARLGQTPEAEDACRELAARIREHMAQLEEGKRLRESIDFGVGFVGGPSTDGLTVKDPNVLAKADSESIHYLLARANYLLGRRSYEYHRDRCGRDAAVVEHELKDFKAKLGDSLLTREIKPCPEADW